MKIAEVRQVAEVFALKALEAKERELAMRLTAAEINRQREIQRRVQAIRQHVIPLKLYYIFRPPKLLIFYY